MTKPVLAFAIILALQACAQVPPKTAAKLADDSTGLKGFHFLGFGCATQGNADSFVIESDAPWQFGLSPDAVTLTPTTGNVQGTPVLAKFPSRQQPPHSWRWDLEDGTFEVFFGDAAKPTAGVTYPATLRDRAYQCKALLEGPPHFDPSVRVGN